MENPRGFTDVLTTNTINSETNTGPEAIAAIMRAHGIDPLTCLYRGKLGKSAIENVARRGHDDPTANLPIYAFEMQQMPDGELVFNNPGLMGDVIKYATTDPRRTSRASETIGGVFVYDKSKMHETIPRRWEFNHGVDPKDALLGIIVVTDASTLLARGAEIDALRNLLQP